MSAGDDAVFAAALEAGDEDALAAECERRLREDTPSGGGLFFRRGWDAPPAWKAWRQQWPRCGEPDWRAWGRDAARALIAQGRAP